jgi:hypothetical protein
MTVETVGRVALDHRQTGIGIFLEPLSAEGIAEGGGAAMHDDGLVLAVSRPRRGLCLGGERGQSDREGYGGETFSRE